MKLFLAVDGRPRVVTQRHIPSDRRRDAAVGETTGRGLQGHGLNEQQAERVLDPGEEKSAEMSWRIRKITGISYNCNGPLTSMQARVVLHDFNGQSGSRRAMAKGKRVRRGQQAGVKGVPQKLDHYRILVLCAAGKKYSEIAAELGISMASVARVLAKPVPKR